MIDCTTCGIEISIYLIKSTGIYFFTHAIAHCACKWHSRTSIVHYSRFFFKENVRHPVWTCRDPISLILGPDFL